MKTVILSDEQSLRDNVKGVIGVIGTTNTYISDGGFQYIVMEVTDHKVKDTTLAIVEKHIDGVYDTYVCYVPTDVVHGSRNDNSFLFADDDCYNPSIYADGHEFVGKLHANVEARAARSRKTNPGFAVEYRADDSVENPAVFVFETINPDTQESFVELYRGYLVNKDEVSIM